MIIDLGEIAAKKADVLKQLTRSKIFQFGPLEFVHVYLAGASGVVGGRSGGIREDWAAGAVGFFGFLDFGLEELDDLI